MGFPAYRNPTLECSFIDHESRPKFAVIDAQTALHCSDGRMKETMSIKMRGKKRGIVHVEAVLLETKCVFFP